MAVVVPPAAAAVLARGGDALDPRLHTGAAPPGLPGPAAARGKPRGLFFFVSGGLRDAAGGADDVRVVPDGVGGGHPDAAERVLLGAGDVPQQHRRRRRPLAPLPLPGHPRRRQPDAPKAHRPRPHDVPPHLLRRRPPATSPLHLLHWAANAARGLAHPGLLDDTSFISFVALMEERQTEPEIPYN